MPQLGPRKDHCTEADIELKEDSPRLSPYSGHLFSVRGSEEAFSSRHRNMHSTRAGTFASKLSAITADKKLGKRLARALEEKSQGLKVILAVTSSITQVSTKDLQEYMTFLEDCPKKDFDASAEALFSEIKRVVALENLSDELAEQTAMKILDTKECLSSYLNLKHDEERARKAGVLHFFRDFGNAIQRITESETQSSLPSTQRAEEASTFAPNSLTTPGGDSSSSSSSSSSSHGVLTRSARRQIQQGSITSSQQEENLIDNSRLQGYLGEIGGTTPGEGMASLLNGNTTKIAQALAQLLTSSNNTFQIQPVTLLGAMVLEYISSRKMLPGIGIFDAARAVYAIRSSRKALRLPTPQYSASFAKDLTHEYQAYKGDAELEGWNDAEGILTDICDTTNRAWASLLVKILTLDGTTGPCSAVFRTSSEDELKAIRDIHALKVCLDKVTGSTGFTHKLTTSVHPVAMDLLSLSYVDITGLFTIAHGITPTISDMHPEDLALSFEEWFYKHAMTAILERCKHITNFDMGYYSRQVKSIQSNSQDFSREGWTQFLHGLYLKAHSLHNVDSDLAKKWVQTKSEQTKAELTRIFQTQQHAAYTTTVSSSSNDSKKSGKNGKKKKKKHSSSKDLIPMLDLSDVDHPKVHSGKDKKANTKSCWKFFLRKMNGRGLSDDALKEQFQTLYDAAGYSTIVQSYFQTK